MEAPDVRSLFVICCFSDKVIPFAGSGIRAEHPPEITTKMRSDSFAFFSVLTIFNVPLSPSILGIGCPALFIKFYHPFVFSVSYVH